MLMPNTEFKRRMDDRLNRWYKGMNPHEDPKQQQRRQYVAGLVNKTSMFKYAHRLKLPLPERFAEVDSLDALDCRALPERVVVKPNNAANNDGVLLFDGTREVFTNDTVALRDRAEYIRNRYHDSGILKPNSRIIAEEFIQDFDPQYTIPRDFKVYVAGGRPWVIQVVNRQGPKAQWSHRYYSQDWIAYDHFQRENSLAPEIECPLHFNSLMELSTRIAQDIGCFMRVDFYITTERVVFGEFTSYPNAGLQFTEIGNNVLCDLMDRYPDPF